MDYQKNKTKDSYLLGLRKQRRSLKKDYLSKKLDNPFYNRRAKRKEKISGRLKILMISFFALLIILFWLFFYSPLFNIKNIKTNGVTRIGNQQLDSLVFSQTATRRGFIFQQKNLFIFSDQELKKTIQNNYNFAEIKISKKIPNTIILDISERPCAFIWESAKKSPYFIDQDGYLIKEIAVSDSDRSKLPVIEDQRDLPDDNHQISLDRQYLSFVFELYQKVNSTGLKIDKFVIDKNSTDSIRVNLKEGPFLLFSFKETQDKQLNKLIALRQEKLKDNFKNIKYFDLRYGDKVFYIDNQEAGK
jgi:cell division septal protein FtsQ